MKTIREWKTGLGPELGDPRIGRYSQVVEGKVGKHRRQHIFAAIHEIRSRMAGSAVIFRWIVEKGKPSELQLG